MNDLQESWFNIPVLDNLAHNVLSKIPYDETSYFDNYADDKFIFKINDTIHKEPYITINATNVILLSQKQDDIILIFYVLNNLFYHYKLQRNSSIITLDIINNNDNSKYTVLTYSEDNNISNSELFQLELYHSYRIDKNDILDFNFLIEIKNKIIDNIEPSTNTFTSVKIRPENITSINDVKKILNYFR